MKYEFDLQKTLAYEKTNINHSIERKRFSAILQAHPFTDSMLIYSINDSKIYQ